MGILNKKKIKALEIRLSQKIAGGLWDFFGLVLDGIENAKKLHSRFKEGRLDCVNA